MRRTLCSDWGWWILGHELLTIAENCDVIATARQSASFRAKHQIIAVLIAHRAVRRRAFGGQGEQAVRLCAFNKRGVIAMALDGGELVVIQTGAAQALIIPGKPHRLDNMQIEAGVSAQADDPSTTMELQIKKDKLRA